MHKRSRPDDKLAQAREECLRVVRRHPLAEETSLSSFLRRLPEAVSSFGLHEMCTTADMAGEFFGDERYGPEKKERNLSDDRSVFAAYAGLEPLPDVVSLSLERSMMGLTVGEKKTRLVQLPLAVTFRAPATGTPVSFVDEAAAVGDMAWLARRAVYSLLHVDVEESNAWETEIIGSWKSSDILAMGDLCDDDTVALLVMVPPTVQSEPVSLTLRHNSRPTLEVLSGAGQLWPHCFAVIAGDAEIGLNGAPMAVLVRISKKGSSAELFRLISDHDERVSRASTLFNSILIEKKFVYVCIPTDGDDEANLEKERQTFDLLALYAYDDDDQHTCDVSLVLGKNPENSSRWYLSTLFDLDGLTLPRIDLNRALTSQTTKLFIGVALEDVVFEAKLRAPPQLDASSDIPDSVREYDTFLIEQLDSHDGLDKVIFSAWLQSFPRNFPHPYYVDTLVKFITYASNDLQAAAFLLKMMEKWFPKPSVEDCSQIGDVWLNNLSQNAHALGICSDFWWSLEACFRGFEGYSHYPQPVISAEPLVSSSRLCFPTLEKCVRSVPLCFACVNGMSKFVVKLLDDLMTKPKLFTPERLAALGRAFGREPLDSAVKSLLLNPGTLPISKTLEPRNVGLQGVHRKVEQAAADLSRQLKAHSYGTASLGGSDRKWRIVVTRTAKYVNQRAWELTLEAARNSKGVSLDLSLASAFVHCRETIRILLCARWFAPKKLPWKAGLVPKDLWQHILQLVWKSRRNIRVWSSVQDELQSRWRRIDRWSKI